MGSDYHEKRQFKRIFFSSEDDIRGKIKLQSPTDTHITAQIMDLSEEGMGLTVAKNDAPPVQRGDHLILNRIDHREDLAFLTDIRLEIRWILKHRSLENVGMGCRFAPLPEDVRDRIIAFMSAWMEKQAGTPGAP